MDCDWVFFSNGGMGDWMVIDQMLRFPMRDGAYQEFSFWNFSLPGDEWGFFFFCLFAKKQEGGNPTHDFIFQFKFNSKDQEVLVIYSQQIVSGTRSMT